MNGTPLHHTCVQISKHVHAVAVTLSLPLCWVLTPYVILKNIYAFLCVHWFTFNNNANWEFAATQKPAKRYTVAKHRSYDP